MQIDTLFENPQLCNELLNRELERCSPLEIKQALIAFSSIDFNFVRSLEKPQQKLLIQFWGSKVSTLVQCLPTKIDDEEMLISLVALVIFSVQLASLKTDPILAEYPIKALIQGYNEEEVTSFNTNITFAKPNYYFYKLVYFASKLFKCIEFDTSDIIHWSLQLAAKDIKCSLSILEALQDTGFPPSIIRPMEYKRQLINLDIEQIKSQTFNKLSAHFLITQYIFFSLSNKPPTSPITDMNFYARLKKPDINIDNALICACYISSPPQFKNLNEVRNANPSALIIMALKSVISIKIDEIPKDDPNRLIFSLCANLKSNTVQRHLDSLFISNSKTDKQWHSYVSNAVLTLPSDPKQLVSWAQRGYPPAMLKVLEQRELVEQTGNSFYAQVMKAVFEPPPQNNDLTPINAIALLNSFNKNEKTGSVELVAEAHRYLMENSKDVHFCFIENTTEATDGSGPSIFTVEDIIRSLQSKASIAAIIAALSYKNCQTREEKTMLCEIALHQHTPKTTNLVAHIGTDPESLSLLVETWTKHLRETLTNNFTQFITALKSRVHKAKPRLPPRLLPMGRLPIPPSLRRNIAKSEIKMETVPVKTVTMAVSFLMEAKRFDGVLEIVQAVGSIAYRDFTEDNIRDFLAHFIESSPTVAKAFVSDLCSIERSLDTCYRCLAEQCQAYPDGVLAVFNDMPKRGNCAEIILDNLVLKGEVKTAALQFLMNVLAILPTVPATDDSEPISSFPPLPATWEEDPSATATKTIWDFPSEEEISKMTCTYERTGNQYAMQPWFHCHTCGLVDNTGVCVPCAFTCHRGHSLEFHKPSNFYCDCPPTGRCQHVKKAEVDQETIMHEQELLQRQARYRAELRRTGPRMDQRFGGPMMNRPFGVPKPGRGPHGIFIRNGSLFGPLQDKFSQSSPNIIDAQRPPKQESLMRVIQMMNEVTVKTGSSLPNRLTEDITKINIMRHSVKLEEPLLSISFSDNPIPLPQVHPKTQIVSGHGIGNVKAFLQYKMMMPGLPTIASIADNGVIVADDTKIHIVRDDKIVYTYQFDEGPQNSNHITGVVTSPLDSSVFAASSPSFIYIMSIDGDSISLINRIDLMMQDPTGSHILSLQWVPLMPMVLSFTTQRHLKIFNIPDDCLSPMICFETNGNDTFSSTTFCVLNDTPVALMALTNGQMYKQEILPDMAGPIGIEQAERVNMCRDLQREFGERRQIALSYCESSNLIFTSTLGQLFISRPSDMEKTKAVKLNSKMSNVFCDTFPGHPSLHIFRDQNTITVIDIGDEDIFVSSIAEGCTGIASDGSQLKVASKSGQLESLVAGTPKMIQPQIKVGSQQSEEEPIDYDPEDKSIEIEKVEVPPTFWTESSSSLKPEIMINGVERVSPPFSIRFRQPIQISVQSTEQVIIGVQLHCKSLGSVISINGRKAIIEPSDELINKGVLLPLKKEEVSLNPVTISVLSLNDIFIDDVDVFTIPIEQIDLVTPKDKKEKQLNTRTRHVPFEGSNKNKRNPTQSTIAEMAANALQRGNFQIPTDILELQYTSETIGNAVSICAAKSQYDPNKWTAAEQKAVDAIVGEGKEIPESLWRDIALANDEGIPEGTEFNPKIWDAKEKPMHSLFAAFTTK